MSDSANHIRIGCFRDIGVLQLMDWEYHLAHCNCDYHLDFYFPESNPIKYNFVRQPDDPNNLTVHKTKLLAPRHMREVYDFTIQSNNFFDVIIIPLSWSNSCSLRLAEHIHMLKLNLRIALMTSSLTAHPSNTVPFFDYFFHEIDGKETITQIIDDHRSGRPPTRLPRDKVDLFIEYLLLTQHCLSGNATHADDYPPLRLEGYKRGLTPRSQEHQGKTSVFIRGNVVYGQHNEAGGTMSQDIYNINQAGQVGPNNTARDMTLNQTIEVPSLDLEQLRSDLSTLRAEMKLRAKSADEDQAVGHVAAAEKSAGQGDAKGALAHLKTAGLWALETSKAIGVPVAVAALTHALGA